MSQPTLEALEGRLIAHRTVLALLIAGSGNSRAITALLDDRSVMRDGQEDPGAVPVEAVRLEGAMADEYRLLAEAAARHGDVPSR